ncbi:MAG: hypothetical protein ACIARR_02985 [Phycisphaerales bacterium JB059]
MTRVLFLGQVVLIGLLAPKAGPTAIERMPTSIRRTLEREWSAFYVGPDGSLWDARASLEKPKKPADDEYMDAFDAEDAPKWYGITYSRAAGKSVTCSSMRTVRELIQEVHNQRMQLLREKYLRDQGMRYVERMRVEQVLEDGLRVRFLEDGREEQSSVFLEGYPLEDAVVDDDTLRVDLLVKYVGRFQYSTVLGSTATIEKYRVHEQVDWSRIAPFLMASEVTLETPDGPEHLAELLWSEEASSLADWRLVRVRVKDAISGRYRYVREGTGSLRRRRKITIREPVPAVYEWRWVNKPKQFRWKSISD